MYLGSFTLIRTFVMCRYDSVALKVIEVARVRSKQSPNPQISNWGGEEKSVESDGESGSLLPSGNCMGKCIGTFMYVHCMYYVQVNIHG